MFRQFRKILFCWLAVYIPFTWLPAGTPGAGQAPFGFEGLEIFRASSQSTGLWAGDLNGDGLTDLAYADNADATIRFLLQETPEEREKRSGVDPLRGSANEIEFDNRFRMERFFTEKKVTSLAVADLNGDRKPDLAYYGDQELEVVLQEGDWGSRREKFAIQDGLQSGSALQAIDLNGDGRSDLVLLGKGKTYLIYQRRDGGLEKPEILYNGFSSTTALRVGDLNGDGRLDLVFLQGRSKYPFIIRFQGEGGFGPEIAVKSLPPYEVELASLDEKGPALLISIQGNSRRIRVLRWERRRETLEPPLGEPRYYGLRPEGDPAKRRIQFGDVNGDGRVDMVSSSHETAELDVYLQGQRGELLPPSPFPTLAEVRGIAIGELDGKGAPEVVVISSKEKAIGVCRWLSTGEKARGRLSIPETHLVEGEPLLVAAGPGEPRELSVIYRGDDKQYHLSFWKLKEKLELLADHPFQAGAEPGGLSLFDANGDGLLDAMVFIPYEDPRLYLREETSNSGEKKIAFREVSRGKDFGIGQMARLDPTAFGLTDSLSAAGDSGTGGGSVMLVAQRSYARALRLDPSGRLRILEQFSGSGAQAQLVGAAAVNLDEDPEKEVLLFDRTAFAINILDRSGEGTYRPARSIEMPGFQFTGFRIIDLDGDHRDDVAVLGKQLVAVLYARGEEGELKEIARYDGEDNSLLGDEEKMLPNYLVTGDLNGDGKKDIVFSSQPKNLLSFLTAGPGTSGLHLKLSFPIFEEKSFMSGRGGYGPREILATDLNGDGKTDLVLLIHDRILFYPQD